MLAQMKKTIIKHNQSINLYDVTTIMLGYWTVALKIQGKSESDQAGRVSLDQHGNNLKSALFHHAFY